jgi:hypothetical protein
VAQGQYGPCIEHHSIAIYDRGGARLAHSLVDIADLEYGRERDAKSASQFIVAGQACRAQASVIAEVAEATGRYEAVVSRGQERVWEGPLRRVETLSDRAVFMATDIKEYLDRTSLSVDWPGPDLGGPPLMGDRLEEIITWELSEDYVMDTNGGPVTVTRWENLTPPINVLPFMLVYPGTVPTRSSTLAFQMMLGQHMDDLVDGGIDYTVVGRRLVIWDSSLSIGQTRVLTDADFLGDIAVIRDASQHRSISHLSAGQEGEDGTRGVGHAGATHPYYGSWENIVSQQSEEGTSDPTQTELNTQANRDILHRTPVPMEVRVPDGVGIRLTHDLTIAHLVPGTIMPVVTAKNIQVVRQPQRLDSMKVKETSAGEVVTVSLSPWGGAEVVG